MSIRLIEKELCVFRPPRNISKYIMQDHQASHVNAKRWELLMSATNRIDEDGLSNIENLVKIVSVQEFYKYTRVLVNVSLQK